MFKLKQDIILFLLFLCLLSCSSNPKSPIYPQDTKTKNTRVLLTSDFNSGSGFSVVAAAADDTDADADDAASGAALVFVVVVVFSAVSASAATLTALITLLDFCRNDVDVLFVPPLFFDDDDAVA